MIRDYVTGCFHVERDDLDIAPFDDICSGQLLPDTLLCIFS